MSAFSRVGGGVLLGDGKLAGGLWGGGANETACTGGWGEMLRLASFVQRRPGGWERVYQ